jgi:hypothetical protein
MSAVSWVWSFRIAADHVNCVVDPLGREHALLQDPDPSNNDIQGRLQLVGERCEKLILEPNRFCGSRLGPGTDDRERYLSSDHPGELQLISAERARNVGVEHELADHPAVARERNERHRPDALGRDDLAVRLE